MRKATFVSESSGHSQSKIKRFSKEVLGFFEVAFLLPLFLILVFRESPAIQDNAGDQ